MWPQEDEGLTFFPPSPHAKLTNQLVQQDDTKMPELPPMWPQEDEGPVFVPPSPLTQPVNGTALGSAELPSMWPQEDEGPVFAPLSPEALSIDKLPKINGGSPVEGWLEEVPTGAAPEPQPSSPASTATLDHEYPPLIDDFIPVGDMADVGKQFVDEPAQARLKPINTVQGMVMNSKADNAKPANPFVATAEEASK